MKLIKNKWYHHIDSSGRVRILMLAEHEITGELYVLYQDEKDRILVLPQKQFTDGRFVSSGRETQLLHPVESKPLVLNKPKKR